MKNDLKDREDIRRLIDAFYTRVRRDELIGPIFNDVAKVDWEHHLPIMYDFWEGVLFHSGGYAGNPMRVHKQLNEIFPLEQAHFDRWLQIFRETLDEHFEGAVAEQARQRALSIATMIRIKTMQG
ncbi:MAG: group III truncated hemoglobin [Chitinophagaceae bacterium]|nr:group III truncated hemoglobin [Chitinophagaceae bacterium]